MLSNLHLLNWQHTDPLRLARFLVIFLSVGKFLSPVVAAPQPPAELSGGDKSALSATENQRLAQSLVTDRKAILTVEAARMDTEGSRWEAVIDGLRSLQALNPETMVPADRQSATFIPLYRAAFSLWLNLTSQDRQQFGERDEAAAERALEAILESGQIHALPELILKSIGTDAAIQAHLIAAKLHLDRGNTLAARVWLEPLQHENVEGRFRDLARTALSQLESQLQNKQAASGRSASSESRLPRHRQWQYRPLASPQLRQQIDTFIKAAVSSRVVLQSSWTEQLHGGLSFRRTMRGVAAINLTNGEPVWEYPLSPGIDRSITANNSNNLLFQRIRANSVPEGIFASLDQTVVANSFCRNEVLGAVGIDADRVYAIAGDEHGLISTTPARAGLFVPPSTQQTIGGVRLMALEKATGRRVWTVDAASIQDLFKTKSPQLWMAGPPLVSKGKLYGIVEWNGEVALVCFEPKTGEPKWKTILAFPEQSIDKDPIRQLRGATPKAEFGLIWCPTTTDRVVCIDELMRSVVWAGHLPVNTEKKNGTSISRRQPISVTAASAITRRWARSEVINAGDDLVVFSPQSHEIFLFNAVTGESKTSIAVEPSSVVMHADASAIVIAEPQKIYRLNLSNGDKVWSVDLDPASEGPIGRGLLQDGRLLLPMNNGDLLTFRADDGQLLETEKNILPQGAWGQLLNVNAAEGDILYAAPECLIRISNASPATEPRNMVELAAGLMASGKWTQALELITQIDSANPNYHEASRIRFKCLLHLAIDSPETYLEKLKAAQATTAQQAQVRFLEVNALLKAGDTKHAALRLIEILNLDPVLASGLAPVPALAATSDLPNDQQIQVMLPLRTWAGTQLSRLLPKLDHDSDVQRQLSTLPPTALLTLNHPVIRPLLRKSAESETSVETSLHLIHHSVQLAIRYAESIDSEVVALALMLRGKLLAIDGTRRKLLNTVLLEFPESVVQGLQTSNHTDLLISREHIDDDYRKTILKRSQQWTPQSFRAVPVTINTSTSSRSSVMLSAAVLDDPFLREFQWTAMPGDFGRLIARDDGRQWSVPGTFKVYGNYSNRTDTLYRFGSVVILRSFSSITAISVLDRRVIWNRDFEIHGQSFSSDSPDESFTEFDGGRYLLPSENHYRSSPVRFIAAGHRWLCLQHDGNVQMIDTLLGSVVWSVRLSDINSRVIATENVVVIAPTQAPSVCLRRDTAEIISIADVKKLADCTIRSVGSQLVCWKSGRDGRGSSVDWVDPQSSTVVRSVPLKDMTDFRFLDDNTLIGLNNQRQMTVVDLITGAVQSCSFQKDGDPDLPAHNASDESDEVAPELPIWDARRVRISADGMNFYLASDAGPTTQLFRQPSGRDLMRYAFELRAVDRQTGMIRWWVAADGVTMASTDQPNLPVLILIDSKMSPANAAEPYSQNQFRAVNKVTGDQLFNMTVPSKFGLRHLSLESPQTNTLDVSVYGNQLRIQGEAAVAAGDELKRVP